MRSTRMFVTNGGYRLFYRCVLHLFWFFVFRWSCAGTGKCRDSCRGSEPIAGAWWGVFRSWGWRGLALICLKSLWMQREWRVPVLRSSGSHWHGVLRVSQLFVWSVWLACSSLLPELFSAFKPAYTFSCHSGYDCICNKIKQKQIGITKKDINQDTGARIICDIFKTRSQQSETSIQELSGKLPSDQSESDRRIGDEVCSADISIYWKECFAVLQFATLVASYTTCMLVSKPGSITLKAIVCITQTNTRAVSDYLAVWSSVKFNKCQEENHIYWSSWC